MKSCGICKVGKLKRGKSDARRTVDGVTFESSLPSTVCKSCNEPYWDASVLERFELQIAAELARMGRCTPGAFRFMRKAVGLSGVALAELLGVNPETVSRWENGARRIDRGVFALLGGLIADQLDGREDTRKRLDALRKPAKTPRVVIRVRAA